MRPIDVAGFEAKFAGDRDPWSTWTDRDEAVKRRAILHGLGPGPLGRVLELGAGNGSNSLALARRALRLDATEATASGTDLIAAAVADHAPRARASVLVVPGAPPRPAYDALVVAELLYYLDPRAMTRLARQGCSAPAGSSCSRTTASPSTISCSTRKASTIVSCVRPAFLGACATCAGPAVGASSPVRLRPEAHRSL